MKAKQIPAPVLQAATGLLQPYCGDLTPTKLVRALDEIEAPGRQELRPLLDKREVARLLAVSICTVGRLLKRGRLAGRRVGGQWRLDRESVRQLLEGTQAEGDDRDE